MHAFYSIVVWTYHADVCHNHVSITKKLLFPSHPATKLANSKLHVLKSKLQNSYLMNVFFLACEGNAVW